MNESETRQKVIEQLEELKSEYQKRVSNPIYDGEEPRRKLNALDFAISSLKTDLKYDLMYEEEEIFTKDNMVAMLTEIQLEIEELDSRAGYDGNGMPTFSTDYIRKKKVNELIQQKINKLKGKEE